MPDTTEHARAAGVGSAAAGPTSSPGVGIRVVDQRVLVDGEWLHSIRAGTLEYRLIESLYENLVLAKDELLTAVYSDDRNADGARTKENADPEQLRSLYEAVRRKLRGARDYLDVDRGIYSLRIDPQDYRWTRPVEYHTALSLERENHDSRWGSTRELVQCPNGPEGWRADQVRISILDGEAVCPEGMREEYERFAEQLRQENLDRDWTKFMLSSVRRPSTYDPILRLELKRTRYSLTRFITDVIARDGRRRQGYLEAIRQRNERVDFAHSFCLHLTLITTDNRVLITRAEDDLQGQKHYYPGHWSCSIEEQFKEDELSVDPTRMLTEWCERAIREELGLTSQMADVERLFENDDLRVVGLIAQEDILSISIAARVVLGLSSQRLRDLEPMMRIDRRDEEIREWTFLGSRELGEQLRRSASELRHPWHSSARYRMMRSLQFVKQPERTASQT